MKLSSFYHEGQKRRAFVICSFLLGTWKPSLKTYLGAFQRLRDKGCGMWLYTAWERKYFNWTYFCTKMSWVLLVRPKGKVAGITPSLPQVPGLKTWQTWAIWYPQILLWVSLLALDPPCPSLAPPLVQSRWNWHSPPTWTIRWCWSDTGAGGFPANLSIKAFCPMASVENCEAYSERQTFSVIKIKIASECSEV